MAVSAVARASRPHLFLVRALVAVARTVMIWRWVLVLRAPNSSIATSVAVRLFLTSSFVGSFLPAGVGGDATRAYRLARLAARSGDALASVVVERVLGVLSLAALGAAELAVWTPGYGWALASVTAWSVVVQVVRVVQAYVLGLGLGLTVPLAYYLLVMPLGLLGLLLPISVSGFGVSQGVIVWLLRPVGVTDAAAFALSTLIVLTGLAGNLPGLALWLRRPPLPATGA